MTDCQHSPSLRYQKAQAVKRAAIAAARTAAQRRGNALHPRIAASRAAQPKPSKHAALLRDLLTMSESHLRDGNRRTAHCLSVAAKVIAELQAEVDAHNAHPGGTESGTCRPVTQDVV